MQTETQTVWLAIGTVTGLVVVALNVWNLIYTQSIAVRARRIDDLEGKLGATTRQLIDQQLATVTAAYRTAHEAFAREIAEINSRMARGETRFAILEKKDHALEVKILEELRKLSDVVATKQDLERMRKEMGH